MATFTSNIPMIVNNISTMKDVSAQNIELSGNLFVSGSSTMSESLNVVGDLVVDGTLDVSGTTTLKHNLDVSGDVRFGDRLDVSGNVTMGGILTANNNVTILGTLNVQNSEYSYVKTNISSVNLDVSDNIIKINVKDTLENQTTNLPSGIMVQDVSKNVFFGYSGRKPSQEHKDKFVISKTDYDESLSSDTPLTYDKSIDVFINGSLDVSGTISGFGTIPLGGIIMWSGTIAPTGWALCDGTNVSGYGIVPDLKGKFIIGYNSNDSRFVTPGQSAGSFKISVDNLPAHSHGGNISNVGNHTHSGTTSSSGADHKHSGTTGNASANHIHQIGRRKVGSQGGQRTVYSPVNDEGQDSASIFENGAGHTHQFGTGNASANHTHNFGTSPAGGHGHNFSGNQTGSGVDYIQPYYVLAYIIRVI